MVPSTMQQKAYYVSEFAKTSSVSVVERHFHTKFGKEPPHRHKIIRQLDGAPPLWPNNVREYPNDHLPHRWIGRAGENDLALLFWPARSSDLIICDIFFWGLVKDKVFVPSLPQDLQELKQSITNVLNALTRCG
ncbi:hypothetical protein AVEN_122212-1 [Araneus ventricosus]|uniref:Uncharacterized protein n=1 Tax=Araneus ventricosus TaxID=182803 RepID=A0A4Y2UVC1_ARAVE|nr:hypothetical protein AVEN_122212-1 [Araneus ventricosus]